MLRGTVVEVAVNNSTIEIPGGPSWHRTNPQKFARRASNADCLQRWQGVRRGCEQHH
jgi:hypothetical protein